MAENNLKYYNENAKEDYMRTPVSVLRYISKLEEALSLPSVACSTWHATNQLRFKRVGVDMADGTAMNISRLQQMWQSDTGGQKWEDVPFVE